MSLPKGLVWVTGASSGIGYRTVLELAGRGWKVAASARNSEQLEALAENSELIHAYPLDVSDAGQRQDIYQLIRKELGPVDMLVNNAGYGIRGAVEEMELYELRKLFDVNVFAAIALSRLVIPEMRARRSGRIIMVGSVVGRVSIPLSGAYSASKFALTGLSDALRRELLPWDIKVILVEPGPIATGFQGVAKDESMFRLSGNDSPYDPYYEKLVASGSFKRRQFWGAKTVSDVIAEAIEKENPCTRYTVHPVARWLPVISSLLPGKLFDHLISQKFGLTQKARLQ